MSRVVGLHRVMRRGPDYTVLSKITTPHGAVVNDVPCRVYLPRTVRGRPYLEFDLSEAQKAPLTVAEFSAQGHAETPNGVISIQSDIVITQGWSAEHWGPRFIKCTLPGEPWDLEVRIGRGSEGNEELLRSGTFWLTPNRLLNPSLMVQSSYTGDVKVETALELSFQLPSILVRFRRYFSHEWKKQGTWTTSELVAEFNDSIERAKLNNTVEELDDILLLTSLATRHRCVCRGWRVSGPRCETRFYRNRLAVPKDGKIGAQETLVDDPEFNDFLKHAFAAFRQNNGREALRQAIDLLVSSHEETIEASFLKCFASLETLVTLYRKGEGRDTILDPELWPAFDNDLKSFIKGHALFKENSARRKLIYQKIAELNRIAFGTVYRECTESLSQHGFHDDDLWPVVGSSRGLSLAEIRNQIVRCASLRARNGSAGRAVSLQCI